MLKKNCRVVLLKKILLTCLGLQAIGWAMETMGIASYCTIYTYCMVGRTTLQNCCMSVD